MKLLQKVAQSIAHSYLDQNTYLFQLIIQDILNIKEKYSEKDTNASPLIYEEPLLEWQHMQGSKIGINNFFQILSETYKPESVILNAK